MSPRSQSIFVRLFGDKSWYVDVGKRLAVLDLLLQKKSGGRVSLLRMGGFPNLMLTTTGRRTGAARPVCLMYIPYGADYVVVGSNWGQPAHPDWSANLLATPHAEVLERRRRSKVHARYVTGPDRAEIWQLVLASWPDYADYSRRSGGREFRIFVLSKTSQG